MIIKIKKLFLLCLLFMLSSVPLCIAAQAEEGLFSAWLLELKQEALDRGISQATLSQALADIKPLPWIIKADRNQPEFTVPVDEYLARAVNRNRILKGKKLLRVHGDLLADIAEQYKVQPRFLVALWGIETDFGRHAGDVPVVSALATLAYDKRRSAYFREELFQALRILDSQQVSLSQLKGSWAGAIGYMQFMPSVFVKNAVDYDNDGRIEIWQQGGDLFSSAANYLSRSGWQSGQTWGREVKLTKALNAEILGLENQRSLAAWQELGVRRINGADLPQADMQGSLIRVDGENGRVFLVYDNYRTLLKWNRAHSFALAVGTLADRLIE